MEDREQHSEGNRRHERTARGEDTLLKGLKGQKEEGRLLRGQVSHHTSHRRARLTSYSTQRRQQTAAGSSGSGYTTEARRVESIDRLILAAAYFSSCLCASPRLPATQHGSYVDSWTSTQRTLRQAQHAPCVHILSSSRRCTYTCTTPRQHTPRTQHRSSQPAAPAPTQPMPHLAHASPADLHHTSTRP